MKKIPVSFFFNLFSCLLVAQYLHTPLEMEQLMAKSTIDYRIDTIAVSSLEIKFPIVSPGWHQLGSDQERYISKDVVLTNRKMKKYHQKGIKYTKKQKFHKAVKVLEKALAESPNNGNVMKSLSFAYSKADKLDSAQYLLEKVIEYNHIDYQAHLQLAEIHHFLGNKDAAIHHISLAHLLNRNDAYILNLLKAIYKKKNMPFQDWVFNPGYQIIQNSDHVLIKSPKKWLAYANCKAVWRFEAGYPEKMQTLSDNKIDMVEEKECLMNAIIGYDTENQEDSIPALEAFGRVVENKQEDEYIQYEILSRINPLTMSYLTTSELEKLSNYIQSGRKFDLGKDKP